MIHVEVKISDEGLAAALASLSQDLSSREDLHMAMAQGLEEKVRGHLLARNSRSPRTGFYAKASRSVESSWDAQAGIVSIPHRGAALRYYGGRVNMKDRLLAIPTDQVPVQGDERMRPGQFDSLVFIPRRNGAAAGTRGYLVEGEKKTTKGGKSKLVPKPGGKLMFVLREYTDHQPDPAVIPDDSALSLSANSAAEDYIRASLREKGLI